MAVWFIAPKKISAFARASSFGESGKMFRASRIMFNHSNYNTWAASEQCSSGNMLWKNVFDTNISSAKRAKTRWLSVFHWPHMLCVRTGAACFHYGWFYNVNFMRAPDMNTDLGSNRQMPTWKSLEICTPWQQMLRSTFATGFHRYFLRLSPNRHTKQVKNETSKIIARD